MIVSFIVYLVLFVGGIVVMGLAQGLADYNALVFCAGLASVCLSLAWVMRQPGGATRRANNWDGGPGAE
ncbi:hypothetical protein DC31_12105 [Microbacterium sp. CH12i]|uniref:hypothetical protein n=1 Tax=Microbacterium sp. CH12i TaxID=1479651 RepID=UPI000461A155|nr:hypothetical protein [Microbacterium sp. CH12i]KDA05991.1 hypothetical protein DC31_12105 [Microbacterium sp. CH12i]